MRVLHVTTGNLFGGVEAFLLAMARHPDPTGRTQHEFALCFDGRFRDELAAAGARPVRVTPARLSRPWQVWRARRALARALDDRRPTHVVFHGPWTWTALAPFARSGATPVMWAHAPLTRGDWLGRAALLRPPSRIIANSEYTARATRVAAPRADVAVVHCAVPAPPRARDPGIRLATRARLGLPEDAFVVMTVGRMEPWKGHRLLLAALQRLDASARTRDRWACVIVGGPQTARERRYFESLQDDVRRSGLGDRVLLAGQRADVDRLLTAADAFCQPNEQPEPFGIAVVEAMYSGLPVVATNRGGPPEIVTPDCGILVEPEAAALAHALGWLCEDRERARRMGAAGVARAAALCSPAAQHRALERALSRW
jgi:glycosyltransferase involved in cell wall biosynthesis